MRLRVFAVATVPAFAIGICVTAGSARSAPPISPIGTGVHATVQALPNKPGTRVTLFDNNNNDSGIGIVSQNFESDFDIYDAEAADDVTVPAGHTWKVTEVIVTGVYFNGSGLANSENVRFYTNTNKGALPTNLMKEYLGVVGADNGFGSFDITLPTAVSLTGGSSGKTYWMSVQANMDFSSGGEWGWEGSLNSSGFPDAWRNPGDGFETGCTSFAPEFNCIGTLGQGPSKMFTLKGIDSFGGS